MAEEPIVKLWEAAVLATLPMLVVAILVLQAHNASRIITSTLFVLLPFAIFPTMYVGDLVRTRITHRLVRWRHGRRQR